MTVTKGCKVEIQDPISKKQEKGIVTEVTTDGFYEVQLDSLRKIIIERSEFTRYGLSLLPDDTVTMMDIIRHEQEQDKGKKKKKTSSETWKLFERTVATDFDTVRNALSGGWKAISNSDTLHKSLYIECKFRDSFPFWENFKAEQEQEHKDRRVGRRIVVYCITDFLTYNGDLWLFDKEDIAGVLDNVTVAISEEGTERYIIASNKFKLSKHKKYKGMLSLYKQTEERATLEHKVPIVAVKMKNRTGYLLGVNPKYFRELHGIVSKPT